MHLRIVTRNAIPQYFTTRPQPQHIISTTMSSSLLHCEWCAKTFKRASDRTKHRQSCKRRPIIYTALQQHDHHTQREKRYADEHETYRPRKYPRLDERSLQRLGTAQQSYTARTPKRIPATIIRNDDALYDADSGATYTPHDEEPYNANPSIGEFQLPMLGRNKVDSGIQRVGAIEEMDLTGETSSSANGGIGTRKSIHTVAAELRIKEYPVVDDINEDDEWVAGQRIPTVLHKPER